MTETALAPMVGRGVTFRDVSDIEKFATLIHRTSLVPDAYRGKVGDCIAVIAYGLELGLNPMQALQNIAFVNGKPSVYGDMLVALVRTSGMLEWMRETAPHEIESTGKAVCEVKRKGEEAVKREFTQAMAEKAGLLQKAGVWKTYPSRMLQMRARSWALRDVFPDVLRGLYAREEAEDIILTMSRDGTYSSGIDTAPSDTSMATPEMSEQHAFLLDQIMATLKQVAPGSSPAERDRRMTLLEKAFGVRGWSPLKSMTVEQLQSGYAHLQKLMAPNEPETGEVDGEIVDEDDVPNFSPQEQERETATAAIGTDTNVDPSHRTSPQGQRESIMGRPSSTPQYATSEQKDELKRLASLISPDEAEDVEKTITRHRHGLPLEMYEMMHARLNNRLAQERQTDS